MGSRNADVSTRIVLKNNRIGIGYNELVSWSLTSLFSINMANIRDEGYNEHESSLQTVVTALTLSTGGEEGMNRGVFTVRDPRRKSQL